MSRLVAGDVRRAVTELVVLAEEDPYRECRWELLMRALDRDQRQGEAIAVYERLADRLANDLGVRPSEPLQRLRLRSEEHTSELQSLMRISYAVFCLKKKKHITTR